MTTSSGIINGLSHEAISKLQELIQANLDSRDGLKKAAEKVDDAEVAAMFEELAFERNDQASELRSIVAANCKEPEANGTFVAAAQRAWMDVLGGGTNQMLCEAENFEDQIRSKYQEVLGDPLIDEIRQVVERQYQSVRASHDRVRDMRDAHLRESGDTCSQ